MIWIQVENPALSSFKMNKAKQPHYNNGHIKKASLTAEHDKQTITFLHTI